MEHFKNKSLFEGLSKRLNEVGYYKDWQQCRAKIRTWRRCIRVKEINSCVGKGRKLCKFFKEVDGILGSWPATGLPVVVQSLNNGEEFSSERSSGEDSESVTFRTKNEELDQARNNNESNTSSDTHLFMLRVLLTVQHMFEQKVQK